ncbi:N-acyl amino acid synthase FeeM domain-containing protein [Pseudobythopirellula maris]|nr:long-chain N-acyl amino acid synthase [Pseudobythopirellula maris]
MTQVNHQRYIDFTSASEVKLQLAHSREHLEGAFRLVQHSYSRAGLCLENEFDLRITPHQLLDTSQVFVATLDGQVVNTQTLVCDGELGLPLESVYAREIDERRAAGVKLAEVTCLADRRSSPKRFFQLFSEMSRVMAQFGLQEGVDEIWIACHPRHAALYERRLGFSRVGGLQEYPCVLGNPAIALKLDLQNPAIDGETWRWYFDHPIPAEVLEPCGLSKHDREYFEEIAAQAEKRSAKQESPADADKDMHLVA